MYSYGCFDRWRMPGPMNVGRYCSIANSVRSVLQNHPYQSITTHPLTYDPKFGVITSEALNSRILVIEDDVWIGHQALILPGCKHIGRGAIIGAGSVITKDVPAYSVIVGNPGSVIKMRFPQSTIEAVEKTKWWERDLFEIGNLYQADRRLLDPLVDADVSFLERLFRRDEAGDQGYSTPLQ
jgi:virginiamycin A acetyltransferase